jgi:hypothetical protein
VVSDDDGWFTFRALAPGAYTIDVRRIGYRPGSLTVNVASGDATPTIVLVAVPAILDSVRIRERSSGMRYSGVVVDDAGLPLPGVAVMVPGVDNAIRTDTAGHFVVPKAVRGTLMLRMRKMGYAAYFGSLRMLADREDTVRMPRLAQALSAVQVLEASGFGRDTFAYRDLDQRLRWKNHQSVVISREEFDEQGKTSICDAMQFTPSGAQYRVKCDGVRMCVILNGERKTLMDPHAYHADQVEMVEYYPRASDWSGNLASRGCTASKQTAVLVVWLRKPQGGSP